jgi:ABC-type polysaccharide/polyol phosphate export permease
MAFINNESLIKKIYLPKALFPLSIAIASLIDSFLSFFALFLIIILLGGEVTWAILFLPISFVLLFFFTVGIGLIMSIATVFFRDLQYVIIIAMQGFFFLTPILYKPDALSGKVAWLISLNPITPFIQLFRAPLVEGILPSGHVLLQSIGITATSILIGLFIFLSQEKKIVFRL